MEQPTIATKVTAFIKEQLLDKQKTFIEQLGKGGLYAFEENLTDVLQDFYTCFPRDYWQPLRNRQSLFCGPKPSACGWASWENAR